MRRHLLWLLGAGGCAPHVVDLLAAADETFAASEVEVRWEEALGPVATGAHYGLNLFLGLDPESANAAGYREGLAKMAPGLVRFFRSDMTLDSDLHGSGWIKDAATPAARWDREKIAKLFPAGLPFSSQWMINLPQWPVAMGPADKPLASEHHEAFAALAADLVKVLNVEQKRGVRSFELFSELEGAYEGRAEEQGALAARVARAMKEIDATIEVGGPSIVHPWHRNLNGFLRGTEGAIDFVSYHGFGAPDSAMTLESALGFGERAAQVSAATQTLLGKSVPIYHTLYSITSVAPSERLTGMECALFDALAMRSFVLTGLTGAAAWNEADGWFGKTDPSGQPRPSGHVFSLFNAHLRGAAVAATSRAPNVAAFAVARAGGGSLALINSGDADFLLSLRETPPAPPARQRRVFTVTAAGLATTLASSGSLNAPAPGGLPVPRRSVVVVAPA